MFFDICALIPHLHLSECIGPWKAQNGKRVVLASVLGRCSEWRECPRCAADFKVVYHLYTVLADMAAAGGGGWGQVVSITKARRRNPSAIQAAAIYRRCGSADLILWTAMN